MNSFPGDVLGVGFIAVVNGIITHNFPGKYLYLDSAVDFGSNARSEKRYPSFVPTRFVQFWHRQHSCGHTHRTTSTTVCARTPTTATAPTNTMIAKSPLIVFGLLLVHAVSSEVSTVVVWC